MTHDCGCASCKPQPTPTLEELVAFPCDYLFKAFGPNGEPFVAAVQAAVAQTVCAPRDGIRCRPSANGQYQCVSVLVRLHNVEQLKAIYRDLHRVAELKYLL